MSSFMAGAVYILAALTSIICAGLLARAYMRWRMHLLLWSSIFFFAFCLDNIILFIDSCVYPDVDLAVFRNGATLIGLVVLIFGLIWESE